MTLSLQRLPEPGSARLSEQVYQSLLVAILSRQHAAGTPVSELAVALAWNKESCGTGVCIVASTACSILHQV